jgi:hypothetical protein
VVDLVVTVDPTSRGPLSTNVRRYVNYYLSDNMLGQAIGGEPGLSRRVTNIDLSARPEIAGTGTSHWTMTTNAIVAGEIRKNILRSVR